MKGVSAILLAAGQSRRMGSLNKLSIPINGRPLLKQTAQILLNANLGEVVVVIGHEAGTAYTYLSGMPLQIAYNECYAEGQMTSVHCGLKALREPCEGIMICLSDLPLLQIADINQLVTCFLNDRSISVLVPTFKSRRGNPIILSSEHQEEILNGNRNLGCKNFIDRNPERVTTVEMGNDHVVFDLDTPEEAILLQVRLAQTEMMGKLSSP